MKKASTWLLVVGWIFSLLGGLIGILIGAHLATAKETGPGGEKIYKYDDSSRKQGIPMVVIGTILLAIGIWLRVSGS